MIHHVMVRGVERRRLFLDDRDYEEFLGRIPRALEKAPCRVLAWALMPNHVHLLVRSGDRGLASFMRRLMTGYAMAFNRRHRRVGHLFQGRFRGHLIEEEGYFLEVSRYIHLNPVKAGWTSRPEDWPWSSVHDYTGNVTDAPVTPSGLSVDRVLLPADPHMRI